MQDFEPGLLQAGLGDAARGHRPAAAFPCAIYALWWTFTADEMIVALRWGVGAVVLVQLSTLLCSFMGMHFETNRVLRELTRVELRLVRLEERWAQYDD